MNQNKHFFNLLYRRIKRNFIDNSTSKFIPNNVGFDGGFNIFKYEILKTFLPQYKHNYKID